MTAIIKITIEKKTKNNHQFDIDKLLSLLFNKLIDKPHNIKLMIFDKDVAVTKRTRLFPISAKCKFNTLEAIYIAATSETIINTYAYITIKKYMNLSFPVTIYKKATTDSSTQIKSKKLFIYIKLKNMISADHSIAKKIVLFIFDSNPNPTTTNPDAIRASITVIIILNIIILINTPHNFLKMISGIFYLFENVHHH